MNRRRHGAKPITFGSPVFASICIDESATLVGATAVSGAEDPSSCCASSGANGSRCWALLSSCATTDASAVVVSVGETVGWDDEAELVVVGGGIAAVRLASATASTKERGASKELDEE
jgi:hypothetical protein